MEAFFTFLGSFLPSFVVGIIRTLLGAPATPQPPLEVVQAKQVVEATTAAAEETKVAQVAQETAAVEIQAPKTKKSTVKKLSDGDF